MSLADIDAMLEQASAPRPTYVRRKASFLFLRPDQTARIRCLYEMNELIILPKHYLYNPINPRQSIDAICGVEISKSCKLCADTKNNKKLTADKYVFIPVYVYGIREKMRDEDGKIIMRNGEPVMRPVLMKEYPDGGGDPVEKPLKGFFLIETCASKATGQILKQLRGYVTNPNYKSITSCDYTLSQEGSGTDKTFSFVPDPLRAVDPRITANAPTLAEFRQIILDIRPPSLVRSAVVDLPEEDSSTLASWDDVPF